MILLVVPLALAQEPEQEPDELPRFGSDVSVGYGAGMLLGAWPDSGVHGFVVVRYDAFTRDRDQAGPRLGVSLWGSRSVYPLQTATEELADGGFETFDFTITHYGVMAALRPDPKVPIGGLFAFGFGRIDLDVYYAGPQALPTLSFEAGLRRNTSSPAFVDVVARADWAVARAPGDVLEEWWGASLHLAVGAHAK